MNDYQEKTLHVETLYAGRIITVKRHQVLLPDGKHGMREVVEHPGAVAVLPILGNGDLLLIRQYRKAVEESLIEIPAGKLEPGELPEACARRELWEETGLTAKKLQFLYSFYTSPGFANERIFLFLAWIGNDTVQRPLSLDTDEFVQPFTVTLGESMRWVMDGRIKDAKTVLAIQSFAGFTNQNAEK